MSDLINRKEAIDRLSEVLTSEAEFEIAKRAINGAPTAYDKDKVIEQLNEASYESYDSLEFADQRQLDLSEAIEIVERGGVE